MSSNPIPETYRCDHLFLLVGTNPLPNFVAAKLLLTERGVLHLVHSGEDTGTRAVAECLRDLLSRAPHGISTRRLIVVREADSADIRSKVAAEARGLSGSVGLNYTGGTKAMAVHAYEALKGCCPKAVFSYLDSRTLSMRIAPLSDEIPPAVAVGTAVRPTIRELTELHGEPLKSGLPSKDVLMGDAAAALAIACSSAQAAQEWRKWCNEELRGRAHPKKDWSPERDLAGLDLRWPGNDEQAAVLKQALRMEDEPSLNLATARGRSGSMNCELLCEWMDGKWLEMYVLKCLKEIAQEAGLHDFGATIDTDRRRAEHDFEMDVAAMRGYQLFAISCTTGFSKGECKSKLFEAVVRARQLGGDEARIGLVSFNQNPEVLQQEVERRLLVEGKVRAWGPDQLPQLADHLRQWFRTAGREESRWHTH